MSDAENTSVSSADTPVPDFRDLLRKPIGDWENKPLLPMGHYFGKCVDVDEGNSSKKGTKYFVFFVQPSDAATDVDPELLKGINLRDYEFPNRRFPNGPSVIWITPNAMPMNRNFFESMGFPITKPMDECINEMRGRDVLMGVGIEDSERSENADGTKRKYNLLVSLTGDPRSR